MASITLSNVPEDLYRRLAERAESHRRTVEDEVLQCLDAVVPRGGPRRSADVDATLEELRRFRESLGPIFLTEDDLQRAKREGRP
jgi:antitoxin FitA